MLLLANKWYYRSIKPSPVFYWESIKIIENNRGSYLSNLPYQIKVEEGCSSIILLLLEDSPELFIQFLLTIVLTGQPLLSQDFAFSEVLTEGQEIDDCVF